MMQVGRLCFAPISVDPLLSLQKQAYYRRLDWMCLPMSVKPFVISIAFVRNRFISRFYTSRNILCDPEDLSLTHVGPSWYAFV